MKKIFRMALVFALAGATLLYTSCTKDYAPDILEVQKKADALDQQLQDAKKVLTDVQTAVANLQTADADLQKKIDDLEQNVADALADLGEDLYGQIADIQDQVDELNELLGGDEGLLAVLGELAEYMGQYFKFIQSIAYVPDYSDGWVSANAVNLADGSLSDTLLVATFKVTPAEAVVRVTEDNAAVEFVASKAAANAPDSLLITKLVYRDDAPGYVDVYAVLNGLELTYGDEGAAIALSVTQEVEDGLVESVTSDYAALWIDEAQDLWFAFADAETGDVTEEEDLYDTEVTVKPSSETDSVQVFTPERWITVGLLGDQYLTIEELAEVLNADFPAVSPLAGDTTFYFEPDGADEYYSDNSDEEAFGASVWPARPGTVVDILNTEDAPKSYELRAYLENSHLGGAPSCDVVATYNVVPDTVAFDLDPVEAVVIPWDYKYWDDVADTTIESIGGVPEDINSDLIADPDETPNINIISGIDYADGVGEVVANTDNSLDAEISIEYAYGEADSTFTFTAQKYNAEDATVYAGSFGYVVEARPADLVVDLGTVDTTVCFENGTLFDQLAMIPGILDVQGEAYEFGGKYDLEDVAQDLSDALNEKADSLVVYFNGEKVKPATWSIRYKATESRFRYPLNEVGTYEFHIFDNAFGIKYEFVLTVNAANNPAEIAPKDTFITIDNEETKDYSVQVTGDYNENFHYFLKEQHLKDYLKVINYAEGGDSLILASALATPEAVGKVKEPLTKNNPTALDRLTEDPTTANLKQKHTYQWAIDEDNKYDSLQFKVAATLIPYAKQDFVVDSATVRLWTLDPVPVFEVAEGGVIAYHSGAQYATAGVLDSLTIQDLKGYDLVGKVGDEYKLLEPDGKTVFDYDQKITVGEPVLVSGAGSIEELRLKLEGTQLILQLNQGVIVTPIVVKVPVTLKHMLCPPKTVDVYVTFKEAEEPVTE